MQDEKSEDIEFIEDLIGQSLNHVVRHSEDVKGAVNITAKAGEEYNVTLHRGTENEPRVIESVSKDELISMLEENL